MDRGAWWAIVHGGRKELDTTERLNTHTHRPRWRPGQQEVQRKPLDLDLSLVKERVFVTTLGQAQGENGWT